MKRIAAMIMMVVVVLSLVGCQAVMRDEADYIARARKELSSSEAETIEVLFAGEIVEGERSLMWFISGNEHQAHEYLPMSCSVAERGGRVFEHAHNALERGTDIVVLPEWQGGYAFCVNNPACKVIRIEDHAGIKEIEVTELPFIYYNDLLPGEYVFLDENGEEVR